MRIELRVLVCRHPRLAGLWGGQVLHRHVTLNRSSRSPLGMRGFEEACNVHVVMWEGSVSNAAAVVALSDVLEVHFGSFMVWLITEPFGTSIVFAATFWCARVCFACRMR